MIQEDQEKYLGKIYRDSMYLGKMYFGKYFTTCVLIHACMYACM